MTTDYELKLDIFSGPLDKLLELIEARELSISQISLAQVTDDFLTYLKGLHDVPSGVLADFVVTASHLILIKSKSLLPDLPLTVEEESNIKDLEDRLRLYRELKAAGKLVQKAWQGEPTQFSRPYCLTAPSFFSLDPGFTVFYPGSGLSLSLLRDRIQGLVTVIQKTVVEEEMVRDVVISLEDKIQEIMDRILHLKESTFQDHAGSGSRADRIVAFLALLHLAREQFVVLEQSGHLSDIIIKRT